MPVVAPLDDNSDPAAASASAVLGFIPPAGGSCTKTMFPNFNTSALSLEVNQVFVMCFQFFPGTQIDVTLTDPDSGTALDLDLPLSDGAVISTHTLLHTDPLGDYSLVATNSSVAGPGTLTITLNAPTAPRLGVRPSVITAGNGLEIGVAGVTPSVPVDLQFYRSCTIDAGVPQLPDCGPGAGFTTGFVFVGWQRLDTAT